MNCTHCNEEQITNYHRCRPKPCTNTQECDCPINIQSKCVTYSGEDLECSGILNGINLDELIQQLDAFICTKVEDITNALTLINVGDGEEIYAGNDLLGRKQIRTLTSVNDIIEINTSEDEIEFNIDEEILTTFIQENQSTVVLENVGTGAEILKTPAVVGNETTYQLKSILVENQGDGESLIRDTVSPFIQENTDDLTLRLKSLVSDTLTITSTDEEISIEQPELTDILRFIVNSAYTGDIEIGSLSKPYKTIENAITAFIGTGTAQTPQLENQGAEIIIQRGVGYTFTGSFALNMCTIILEEGVNIISAPASGDWLCDYDTLSDTTLANLKVILKEGSIISLNKNGFRNSGTDINNSAFTDTKLIEITGTGTIYQNTQDLVNISYTILESNFTTNNDFQNDSALVFILKNVILNALTQQIYKIGGNSVVMMGGVTYKTGNSTQAVKSTLKVFNQIGGQVRNVSCSIEASNPTARDVLFSLTKSASIPCDLILTDCIFGVNVVTLFQNEGVTQSFISIKTSKSSLSSITNIAKSPNVLWVSFVAYGCIFDTGIIDQTEVDLTASNTISSSNTFGGKLVESLQVFGSRVLAVSGGLEKGNAYINRKNITTGAFVVGEEYVINNVGDTDFTLIGASANTSGLNFTATGVGGGTTGTAYLYKRDIIL